MGLSQEYQKRIKESMDMTEGGSLHAMAQKAAAINAPVLIVGLGGSGVDSVLAVKKMIYDMIQPEKNSDGKYSDKPKNIEYIAIDTDSNNENRSYQGIRLNKDAGEISIFTMPNVQPVLANPEILPDYVNKWLDCSMPNESVINGAGAVRQLGRLLLMQNIQNVIPLMEQKIRNVTIGHDANVPLYVFVAAGISGGTGSGSFIDIPYIIKAVSAKISTRPVQNIGLLFLPDINASRSGMSATGKSSLYANGFASLKELDYLMNIEKTGDAFSQKYGNYEVGAVSGRAEKPYDICLLLSGKDKNGTPSADCYTQTTQVIAETIFNFIVGDSGATDFNNFSINSWLSNEARNKAIYQTTLGDQRHPISYEYSIAGASSVKLPMDDVMSYLAFKMYSQVQDFWDKNPEEKNIDAVEKYFHLTQNDIVAGARNNIRPVNTTAITPKIAIENHPQVVQLFEAGLKKQKEFLVENLENMLTNLKKLIDDKNNLINQYFLDFEKGPVFAQHCLFTTTPNCRSVITDLRNFRVDFSAKRPSTDDVASLEQRVAYALEDLKKAFMGKTGKLQVYLNVMHQLYSKKLDVFMYDQLLIFCKNAENMLLDENNEIFDVISDLLNQMMPIFEKYGSIKTSANTTHRGNITTLSWTMIETPDFIKQLDQRMEHHADFSVNLQEVVKEFYQYLFDHVDMWKDEHSNAVENINSFIYKQFSIVLDNSMDFFMDMIAASQGKTLEQYCSDIITELKNKAEIRYPIDASFEAGAVARPGYSFISIPNNSPKLLAAAQRIASMAAMGGATSIVKASGVRDRIFMMNFMSATPLSLNQDIKQFYSVYKEHRDAQAGLHLYVPTKVGKQVSDIDWRDLPSPYPETEWVNFKDEKEHMRNEHYREILDKAIKYGYVVENSTNRTITLYYGNTVEIQKAADEAGIDLSGDSTIKRKTAQDFCKKLENELEKDRIAERCPQKFVRTHMVCDVDGELKKNYEEIIFISMYRLRQEIENMVKNHEEVEAAIQNVESRVMDDSLVEGYVKCRIAGQINRHPKKIGVFIYMDRDETAHELIALDGRQSVYPEYYILKAFMELPAREREVLVKKSSIMLDEGENRDSDIDRLKKYIKLNLSKKIEDLNWNHEEIVDGDKILDTYRTLKITASQLETQLIPEDDFI